MSASGGRVPWCRCPLADWSRSHSPLARHPNPGRAAPRDGLNTLAPTQPRATGSPRIRAREDNPTDPNLAKPPTAERESTPRPQRRKPAHNLLPKEKSELSHTDALSGLDKRQHMFMQLHTDAHLRCSVRTLGSFTDYRSGCTLNPRKIKSNVQGTLPLRKIGLPDSLALLEISISTQTPRSVTWQQLLGVLSDLMERELEADPGFVISPSAPAVRMRFPQN
jgi:hypothetical protein